jgi:hypothetical protein
LASAKRSSDGNSNERKAHGSWLQRSLLGHDGIMNWNKLQRLDAPSSGFFLCLDQKVMDGKQWGMKMDEGRGGL